MYDKSLEQLIDAVIADGVITDQERKVVYKKASSLGIDRDEIEVYLNGRLDAFNKTNSQNSGKQGRVRTCPSCGAIVEGGQVRCKECGYNFTDVSANESVKRFAEGLSRILYRHQGASNSNEKRDRDREVEEYIKNFPIPTSKEDLIEFISSMDAGRRTKSSYQSAYNAKYKACVTKATVLFTDDKAVNGILKHTSKFSPALLTWNQAIIGVVVILLLIAVAFIPTCNSNRAKNIEIANRQRDSLFVLLDNLEVPDELNYKEMEHALLRIVWTDIPDADKQKEVFLARKRAYASQIYSVYRDIYDAHAIFQAPDEIQYPNSKIKN